MSSIRLVFVTLPDEEAAVKMSHVLLEEGLVACGNLIPGVRSIYRWSGKVCDDQEVLVLFKTTQDRFSAVENRITQLHPYECPEVLGVDVDEGHENYLLWVQEQVGS